MRTKYGTAAWVRWTGLRWLGRGFVLWLLLSPSWVCAARAPDIFTRLIFIRDLYDRLTPEEHRALRFFRKGEYINARSAATELLAADPNSMVGHFVMAYILRHAEGELIKALHHLRRAIALYKSQVGRIPAFTHHVMMIELFYSLRQLGRERECLELINRHDRLYTMIKLEDVRPWVLMKLHRYKEARALAQTFLKQKRYTMSALNALCAINFEQNHRRASLRFCREAYLKDMQRKNKINRSVHMINLAEAYLSMFDHSQAETFALKATRYFHRFLPSTPWEFLVGLYLDHGRYNDAWNALRKSKNWYLLQAPELSESVYAGNQMTQSVFFLAIGQPKVALKILERIRDRPDRRGHMSADIRQFVVGERLLRRQARQLLAQKVHERAAASGFWARVGGWFKRIWLRFLAWRDGASVRRALADNAFLQRCLSPYRSGSFSMPNSAIPYWMVGEIIPLVGPAVVLDALAEVRADELKKSPKIRPYLLALEGEALFRQGADERAGEIISQALRFLPARLSPLRGRLLVIDGELARRNGRFQAMRQAFAQVIRKNGLPFRMLQIPLPLASISTSSSATLAISKKLKRSPRFSMHAGGFALQLRENVPYVEASLLDRLGSVLHRFSLAAKAKEKPTDFTRRFAIRFQDELFSPHFRLSRKEIFSLDDSLLRSSDSSLPLKRFQRKK